MIIAKPCTDCPDENLCAKNRYCVKYQAEIQKDNEVTGVIVERRKTNRIYFIFYNPLLIDKNAITIMLSKMDEAGIPKESIMTSVHHGTIQPLYITTIEH